MSPISWDSPLKGDSVTRFSTPIVLILHPYTYCHSIPIAPIYFFRLIQSFKVSERPSKFFLYLYYIIIIIILILYLYIIFLLILRIRYSKYNKYHTDKLESRRPCLSGADVAVRPFEVCGTAFPQVPHVKLNLPCPRNTFCK